MDEKKFYIWQLGSFLHSHKMKMSAKELADNLNRNKFLTSYGTEYAGSRGTFKLIREVYHWLDKDANLPDEATKIAETFVKSDGTFAWN